MAGGKGTKEIATRYPVEDGLIAGTTTQTGHIENLVAQGLNGKKSNVTRRQSQGIG